MHGVLAIAVVLLVFSLVQPAMAQEQVMLESPSDQGTFIVRVAWTPAQMNDNMLAITFVDSETGKEVEDVTYDLSIYSGDGSLELSKPGQSAPVQNVAFAKDGPYTIAISNIEGLGEGATFDVRVTPEFPSLAAAAIAFSALVALRVRRFWR